jgi:primase-polymerase (primpol)-like protein
MENTTISSKSQTFEYLPPNFENIPDLLKEFPNFVLWRLVERDGEMTKPPFQSKTGKLANVSNPATWSIFKEVMERYKKPQGLKYRGIGFVLQKELGICAWDLDKCRNLETGVIEPWAEDIITVTDSYTEISPSGTGIRIFFKGTIPSSRKEGNIEIYDDKRYMTITGHVLNRDS